MHIPRFRNWIAGWFSLLLAFAQVSSATAEELPEKTSTLLQKLDNYEAEQTQGLKRRVTADRSKFVTQLRKDQKVAQERAELDAALAIAKLIEAYQKAGALGQPEIPKSLPENTKRAVKRQAAAEAKLSTVLDTAINKKRGQVVKVMKKQVEKTTRDGDLDGAVAIREKVAELEGRIAASAPARSDKPLPIGSPRYKKGLQVFEFERLASQTGGDSTGFVPLEKLGRPVGKPKGIKSLSGWRYKAGRNAAAIGYLKIEKAGKYTFTSYNYYDRNAIYVVDMEKQLVHYRGGDGAIDLEPGMVAIVSTSYFHAKGSNTVWWKPPGTEKNVLIPEELLFHLPDEAEAMVARNAKAVEKATRDKALD